MPNLLACNVAALFIATFYYAWRDWYMQRANHKVIRERVTYMLWVASQR